MPFQINKKIFIYIFFFIIFATLNNNNFLQFKLSGINKIDIHGLSEDENFQLKEKLNILKSTNLFLLDKIEIKRYLDSNNIIDKYTILKKYPSSLEIRIIKTNFLANVYKNEKTFFLGSNGKLIETNKPKKELFNIFGKFDNESFFDLLKNIKNSKFDLSELKNLYFFKSGRWDIETNSGILIKLPVHNSQELLDLSFKLLKKKEFDKTRILDLRQSNQVIINGE
ncbi:FtsQ-type POTRA domain-containing protein [Candidatus Pelagibacter sp.]|nr:FtsQ-type POTRA domain-containing protein [Candidatus Pelagibacter sp.]